MRLLCIWSLLMGDQNWPTSESTGRDLKCNFISFYISFCSLQTETVVDKQSNFSPYQSPTFPEALVHSSGDTTSSPSVWTRVAHLETKSWDSWGRPTELVPVLRWSRVPPLGLPGPEMRGIPLYLGPKNLPTYLTMPQIPLKRAFTLETEGPKC